MMIHLFATAIVVSLIVAILVENTQRQTIE
jgi:hypothetical protein